MAMDLEEFARQAMAQAIAAMAEIGKHEAVCNERQKGIEKSLQQMLDSLTAKHAENERRFVRTERWQMGIALGTLSILATAVLGMFVHAMH